MRILTDISDTLRLFFHHGPTNWVHVYSLEALIVCVISVMMLVYAYATEPGRSDFIWVMSIFAAGGFWYWRRLLREARRINEIDVALGKGNDEVSKNAP